MNLVHHLLALVGQRCAPRDKAREKMTPHTSPFGPDQDHSHGRFTSSSAWNRTRRLLIRLACVLLLIFRPNTIRSEVSGADGSREKSQLSWICRQISSGPCLSNFPATAQAVSMHERFSLYYTRLGESFDRHTCTAASQS